MHTVHGKRIHDGGNFVHVRLTLAEIHAGYVNGCIGNRARGTDLIGSHERTGDIHIVDGVDTREGIYKRRNKLFISETLWRTDDNLRRDTSLGGIDSGENVVDFARLT